MPNSGKNVDACMVCGGDGLSCRGCDLVQAQRPARADSCNKCGGGKFGACACNYAANTNSTACAPGCDGVPGSRKQARSHTTLTTCTDPHTHSTPRYTHTSFIDSSLKADYRLHRTP